MTTDAALRRYLEGLFHQSVEVLHVAPLGGDERDDVKGFGYGVPLNIRCRVGAEPREFVLARTRPVSGFAHDYPADRAWQALFSHGAYNSFPRHARSLDVGCARGSRELVSVADATEFFQLVEKVEGTLYRGDLDRLLTEEPTTLDVSRVTALARFLATTWRRRTGIPHEQIVKAAAEEGAMYVVMSTHGRGGFQRLIIGSVADRVVRTAACPVLTVCPSEPGRLPIL